MASHSSALSGGTRADGAARADGKGAGAAGRPGLALVVGLATAVGVAAVFGLLEGRTGRQGHEVGYWALALGVLLGAVLGKVGGRSRLVPWLGVPVALLAVAVSQLVTSAVQVAAHGGAASTLDALTGHVGLCLDYWWDEIIGRNDITFYCVAALEGALVAKRVAE
ncbi:hypothetical protein [Streptomyces sp. URMC 123]|uniref:hypothetical protein n=1 Tax=Streptomyces sp. URMC 123 TaxID=3423403 RepID=UPI003F1930A3